MCRRLPVATLIALFALDLGIAAGQVGEVRPRALAPAPAPELPADQAVLDLKIVGGAGAKVFVGGVPKNSTRIRFVDCRPDRLDRYLAKVIFPDGETVT